MTTPPADIPGVPRPGEVLAGKYRVERILGAGGMGVVLAAWHLVLERRVAVKFLLPAATQLPDAGARFLREARAAAALEGEHVARVLDVGTLDTGAPYMVLEHLSGADLGSVLKSRGPLPLHEAIDLLLQACEAIAEAHARGIIHRDLKPKNVFLTRRPDGTPLIKVLDFGLSKILQGAQDTKDASLTATDLIMGSFHYMSPEQIRSLKYADARTDVWALGVILYEMLAGRRPFQGDTLLAVTAAVVADAPMPLSTFRLDVPPAIDALISRCLEKTPARRIQSVTELARGLAPFGSPRAALSFESIARLLPEPVAAPPPPPRGSFPSFGGMDAVAPAPVPRAALPSSSGAGAASPQALTSWGHTRRISASKTAAVVLAGAGITIGGAAALAWVIFVRAPADDPAAAASVPAAAESSAPPSTAVEPAAPTEEPSSTPPAASATLPIASTSPTGSTSTPPAKTAAAEPALGKPGPSATQTVGAQPSPPQKTPPKKTSKDVMKQWD